MPSEAMHALPVGAGGAEGTAEGVNGFQSMVFQAIPVARALGFLAVSVMAWPDGRFSARFEDPQARAAAVSARCGPAGPRRGTRGGRAHHANSQRAQTPAQPAVAHARGQPAPAASAAAGKGNAPKADAKAIRRKEKAKNRRHAKAAARRAAGLPPRRSPSAIRSATARAVAHRHARKAARVGTLQRAEGAEEEAPVVAANGRNAGAPRPVQSGRRLALEPSCVASDDLDPSGDEGIDVCTMDLDSLPAATTPVTVAQPRSATRRSVKGRSGGPAPAARLDRD